MKTNLQQMHDILTMYGSVIVRDVLYMIDCCDIMVIRNTWDKMNMKKHVECVDELLKINI